MTFRFHPSYRLPAFCRGLWIPSNPEAKRRDAPRRRITSRPRLEPLEPRLLLAGDSIQVDAPFEAITAEDIDALEELVRAGEPAGADATAGDTAVAGSGFQSTGVADSVSDATVTDELSAKEQAFIYMLNRARHDPQAYEDEVNPAVDLSEIDARPPLAVNALLADSSQYHSDQMTTHDFASHENPVTGEFPNEVAEKFGYDLPDFYGTETNNIESIAAGTNFDRPALPLQGLIESDDHRRQLLAEIQFFADHREIGVGYSSAPDTVFTNYWTVHTAYEEPGDLFLTGVIIDDVDDDGRYDPGEGLGGVDIQTESGASTTTGDAGGWSLPVSDGTYELTVSGGGFSGEATQSVEVAGSNVAVDFISGRPTGVVNFDDSHDGPPVVLGRHVFHNNSAFDGGDAGANASDDAAIAPNVEPLLPGETATSGNLSNNLDGITGLVVDIAGLADAGNLSADDFTFRLGNDDTPGDWADAPAPQSVSVRPGAGQGGSARVTLIWQPGEIRNTWLEVTVKANANTGLASPDVFYFGNQAGDTNGDRRVNATDVSGAFANLRGLANPAPADFPYDINRDGRVNATDVSAMFANLSGLADALSLIQPGDAMVSAPVSGDATAGDVWLEAERRAAGGGPNADGAEVDALALTARRAAWDWWRLLRDSRAKEDATADEESVPDVLSPTASAPEQA